MRRPLLFGFGIAQQIPFTRSLSTYLSAGIPIREALEILRQGTQRDDYLLERLIDGIVEGRTLSGSMRAFPHVFKAFTVTLVEIGEESGTMREALEHIAETLTKQQTLSRKIRGALAYPVLIIAATLGICSFLILYAFPKIVPLFRGFGTELPLTTRSLIALSDAGAAYGLWVLIGIGILSVGIIFLLRKPVARRVAERLLLIIPGSNALVRAFHLTEISRTLSVLLASGVPIVRALELAATLKSQVYTDALQSCRALVLEGEKLSRTLTKHPHCFPRTYIQMVATGERTGTLSSMFRVLEKQYEEEFDSVSTRLTSLLEPALMILVGFLVGFIALAIITPVYQITQGMHG